MTYTYDFYFGKTDSSTFMHKDKLVVEYVHSSVSNGLKIVEMVRHGEDAFGVFGEQRHCISWFSKEGRERLFEELENDMTDRMCGTGNHSIENDLEIANMEADWMIQKAEVHFGI